MSEQFPEMLNALQLAGLYCSMKENWDSFEQWTRRLGGLEEEEHLSREFMVASAKAMDLMIRQVEIQLIAARLDAELGPGELPFEHVAAAGGMCGNGHRAFLSGGDHGEEAQGRHEREGAGGAGEEDLRELRGEAGLPGIRAGEQGRARAMGRADPARAGGDEMTPFPCFSCGSPMLMTSSLCGWCDRCQVMEFRDPEPYFCRTRMITSEVFRGQRIVYLDHAAGHYPSPA